MICIWTWGGPGSTSDSPCPTGRESFWVTSTRYKDGTKSSLQWGEVATATGSRKIFPASKDIQERTHIIKLDLEHEIRGLRIEDSFRGEFYDLETRRPNVEVLTSGTPAPLVQDDIREAETHFQGANTLRLEKRVNDWLYASGGYLYSRLRGDAAFALDTSSPLGVPIAVQRWRTHRIVLERDAHVFNANGYLGPWDGLSFSAGVQSEWNRQTGVGDANLDIVNPFSGVIEQPASLRSDIDQATVEERIETRFTAIPFTVLFASARLQQESIGQHEEQAAGYDFLRDTDSSSRLQDFRAGFTISPWQRVSLTGQYRRYEKNTTYDKLADRSTELATVPGAGYSEFIRARSVFSDEAEIKLVVRPASWWKASFGYKLLATDYNTATDPVPDLGGGVVSPGGSIFAGNYDAHIFSLGNTFTLWHRVSLSTTFAYQNGRTVTAQNQDPTVVPYKGDTYTLLASMTAPLTKNTDLLASYSFSYSDYSQTQFARGLPLGVQYTQHGLQAGLRRRLTKNLVTRLQYGFFQYAEPTRGGANDYTAHAVLATISYVFP